MPTLPREISPAMQDLIYESTGLGDIVQNKRHRLATVELIVSFNRRFPGCFNTKKSVTIALRRTECILNPSDIKTIALGDSEVVVPNLAKLWNTDSSPVGIFENVMKVVMPAEFKAIKLLAFANKIKNEIQASGSRL